MIFSVLRENYFHAFALHSIRIAMKISLTNALQLAFTCLLALCVSSIFAQNEYNVRGSSINYVKNTPMEQVLPLHPTFKFYNRGAVVQENVRLACDITDPAGSTTTIDTILSVLPPSTDVYTNTLSTSYTPAMVGEYTVRFYNNGTGMTNYGEGVDEEFRTFSVTDDILSNDAIGAATMPYMIEGNWAYGIIFPAVTATEAVSASFVLANPAELLDETINIILHPLDPNNDGNIDEDGDFAFGGIISDDIPILDVAGYQSYTITADNAPGDLITVDLVDLIGMTSIIEGTPENPRPYLLLIEHITSSVNMSLAVTADDTFSPFTSMTNADGSVTPLYGSMLRTGDESWQFNFGEAPPVMRINTAPLTNVPLPQLDDSQVTLAPNPASETVNIALELKEVAQTVQIHLLDIMGRVIQHEVHNNVKDQIFTMNLSKLTAGTYFVNVITDEGRKTVRLAVGK